jgi:hypothetical protein
MPELLAIIPELQDAGTVRGSDIAAAAIIVTKSTRRVHISVSCYEIR